jgi:hypothetical protein
MPKNTYLSVLRSSAAGSTLAFHPFFRKVMLHAQTPEAGPAPVPSPSTARAPGYGPWLWLLAGYLLLNGLVVLNFYRVVFFPPGRSDDLVGPIGIAEVYSGPPPEALVVPCFVLLFLVVMLYHFFRRKVMTPRLILGYLGLQLLAGLVNNYNAWFGEPDAASVLHLDRWTAYNDLLVTSLICLAAVPYLVLSRRVRDVFVQ